MIGQMVSNYRILEIIGRGSMGIVFKALDTATGRLAALKILAEKLADDPQMLSRFAREGGAASALHHPNICAVYETGEWKGRPYLAMELLTGGTLDQLLAAGPVPAPRLIEIAIGVTRALEAAHAIGVVHRDIKPANLFLTAGGQVKVLDFGLAKVKPPAAPLGDDAPTVLLHVTHRNMVLGTLAYMSPEQVCCEPLDGRADLYSLGVVIYELATGRLPVRGAADPSALPRGLGPVAVRLMAGDPRSRYQTAAETREALERLAVPDSRRG
ncbi:MAG: serine/threonine protein kinase [Acidobacteriota bacterium]|nr:serine/threonine protein kinase [Acidobacteriota bacterium]